LTHQQIPIKLDEKNRGCSGHRDQAAVPFFPPIGWEIVQLVGLQTLNQKQARLSSYFSTTYVVLRCTELLSFFTSLVKKSVKNCTKMQQE
jgi:hypothetical protein